MAAVARVGDPSNHGGHIVTGSSDVKANGIGVARDGDSHFCPLPGHGTTPLSSSASSEANGKSVVRVGDRAACGAHIISGSSTVNAA